MATRGDSQKASVRRGDVAELLAAHGRALHKNEIMTKLGLDVDASPALERILDDLAFDGSIVALPGQRFRIGAGGSTNGARKTSAATEIEGLLHANPRGFGFVGAEGGDIFIPREALRGAMHGDRVIARVVSENKKGREGFIVSVVTRRKGPLGGRIVRERKVIQIEPDDVRIRGPVGVVADDALAKDAPDGAAVIFEIVRHPENLDELPTGRVTLLLGKPGTPDVEVRKILLLANVEDEHSADAIREAESYGKEVDPAALVGRKDYTSLPLPTIDPMDARDHDDALWAVRHPDGSYTATIAIADVSHYVRPETALDTSAFERGCSIYLPNRAIPMLPRALSSTLCSLLPEEVRLCMVAEVDLGADGTVHETRFFEGFMRSCAKLHYEGVARALEYTTEVDVQPQAEAMKDDLAVLADLAGLLRARRMRRGALDLEAPEAKIVLDAENVLPIDAVRRGRDPGVAKAYRIVEEFMLLANEAVAERLLALDVPTVFRNHEQPEPEKIAKFGALCKKVGLTFDPDVATTPKGLTQFIKKINAHPQRELLHQQLIRSMKQAFYGTDNKGHFGLASDAYLHFTSPIRRYPDLLVHRALRRVLRREKIERDADSRERLRVAAEVSSQRERRAMDVERDVLDLYRVLLMKEHISETFAGSVSAIVGSGVFVTLESPYVDVLVRGDALGGEGFEAADDGLSMSSRSGERIDVGDGMLVTIEEASIERRLVLGRRVGSTPRDGDGGQARGRSSDRRKVRSHGSTAERNERNERGGKAKSSPSSSKSSAGNRTSGKPGASSAKGKPAAKSAGGKAKPGGKSKKRR
jgi:ribonuclease R